MNAFQAAVFAVSRTAAGVSAAILVAMVAHIMLEIFLRNFFDTSTFALDEFVGYEVAAMAFLALGYSLEKRALIRVSLLQHPLRNLPRLRQAIELFCALATLAAVAIPIVFFGRSIRVAYERGYTTGTITNLPQWIPEVFVLLGLLIFWVQLFAYALRVFRGEVDLQPADAGVSGAN